MWRSATFSLVAYNTDKRSPHCLFLFFAMSRNVYRILMTISYSGSRVDDQFKLKFFCRYFINFFFHDAPCWQFISNWTLFWHTNFYIHHSLDGKFDNEIAKDSLFQCYQLRIHRTRTTLLIIEWHADKPKHSSSFRGFAMNVNIHDIGKQYVPYKCSWFWFLKMRFHLHLSFSLAIPIETVYQLVRIGWFQTWCAFRASASNVAKTRFETHPQ